QMVAYHTWITKIAAVVMSAGLVILLFTKSNLVFHIAVYVLILEALESLIITFILETPRANVRSLWHVLKNR
ncbi:MAG: CDP-alcohol phosphatidyltransferase family protein, partial [Sulfurimonadaceae bacterium]